MRPAFYLVDDEYIQYLKNVEIAARGFTTVPNMEYSNNHKFVYGVVLNIGSIAYFAPIFSYTKPQQDNIIIKVMNHGKMEAEGSIRFNYMIPVPERHLTYYDLKTKESFENC